MKKRKRKAGRNNRKPVQEKRTDLERKDLDMEGSRIAEYTRKTKETDISLTLELDGNGNADVDTGIGFFDHMLEGFARHGLFDLKAKVKGDLIVDCHHTIEDTGIVLGSAIKEAVGDKKGLKRFGSCILPMDETLVLCALDLSGRPYLSFEAEFTTDRVGYMDTEMCANMTQDRKDETSKRIPQVRWGLPEDMKGPVLFLASAASDYLNGAIIPVDGGYLCK